jgi:hypothetical protein
MRMTRVRKWLLTIALGGCLFGRACPNTNVQQSLVQTSVQATIGGILGLAIQNAVSQAFNTGT